MEQKIEELGLTNLGWVYYGSPDRMELKPVGVEWRTQTCCDLCDQFWPILDFYEETPVPVLHICERTVGFQFQFQFQFHMQKWNLESDLGSSSENQTRFQFSFG